MEPSRRAAIVLLLCIGAGACATRAPSGGDAMAGMAPMLSVERFLQAANSRDLDAMARIFGRVSGPVADTGGTLGCAFQKLGDWIGLGERCTTQEEVELRMDAIAQILQHDDYRIVNEQQVPGRRARATRIGVDLTMGDRTVEDVPFVVVRTSGGRWLVEQIGLERITTVR